MPRRILLLITDLEIGGTPTVVRELAIRLNAPPGVMTHVACLGGWGPVADQLSAMGIPTTAAGGRGAADVPRVIRQVVRLIRRGKYDTVVSFLVHANLIAAAAAPFCHGTRFVQSIRTTQVHPRWSWPAMSVAHVVAERVVVPTASVARTLSDRSHVPREKIAVISNAIDPENFRLSPVPQTDPRPYPIGFVGRLDPVKRIEDLAQATSLLRPLVRLSIFGEGGHRTRIEESIRRSGLSDIVNLHGPIERADDALQRIGLLVLPSEAEGFGIVLIEAMAAGVPVVATDVPGIRDVVRHGVTGLLVPPRAPERLAATIRRVVEDRSLRGRLARQGLDEVRRRFSWARAIEQYRALLKL